MKATRGMNEGMEVDEIDQNQDLRRDSSFRARFHTYLDTKWRREQRRNNKQKAGWEKAGSLLAIDRKIEKRAEGFRCSARPWSNWEQQQQQRMEKQREASQLEAPHSMLSINRSPMQGRTASEKSLVTRGGGGRK